MEEKGGGGRHNSTQHNRTHVGRAPMIFESATVLTNHRSRCCCHCYAGAGTAFSGRGDAAKFFTRRESCPRHYSSGFIEIPPLASINTAAASSTRTVHGVGLLSEDNECASARLLFSRNIDRSV